MAFSDNLKAAMDKQNMSPLQLAAELEKRGVAVLPVTIERWRRGETSDPNMASIIEVARVLEVTVDDLFHG
jgi:transcriptional regulator with XRE-family HTH domain